MATIIHGGPRAQPAPAIWGYLANDEASFTKQRTFPFEGEWQKVWPKTAVYPLKNPKVYLIPGHWYWDAQNCFRNWPRSSGRPPSPPGIRFLYYRNEYTPRYVHFGWVRRYASNQLNWTWKCNSNWQWTTVPAGGDHSGMNTLRDMYNYRQKFNKPFG